MREKRGDWMRSGELIGICLSGVGSRMEESEFEFLMNELTWDALRDTLGSLSYRPTSHPKFPTKGFHREI